MSINSHVQSPVAAIALIRHMEGCRLDAYRDTVGVWTIGYGHTKGVRPGMTITQSQAERFLAEDLRGAERVVTRSVKVPLSDHEYGALVSLVYNIGGRAFRNSSCLRALNKNNRPAAADAMELFVKGRVWGRKRTLQGLVRRRRLERALFECSNDLPVRDGAIRLASETIPASHAMVPASRRRGVIALVSTVAALVPRPSPRDQGSRRGVHRSVAALSLGTVFTALTTSWSSAALQLQGAWHAVVSSGLLPSHAQLLDGIDSTIAQSTALWQGIMDSDAMPTKEAAATWLNNTLVQAGELHLPGSSDTVLMQAQNFAASHQSIVWVASAVSLLMIRHLVRRYVRNVISI